MKVSEIIFSIEWYFKSKNLALKNALAIHFPMNTDTHLLSITELICDNAATKSGNDSKFLSLNNVSTLRK